MSKVRNTGRIIDLERGSVRVYEPDFIKSMLIKSFIKEKKLSYDENDYYQAKVDYKMEPYSGFQHDDKGDDVEVFDKIDESQNPNRILPFIFNKSDNTEYLYKGIKRHVRYEVHKDRMIDFFNDFGEPYMKIDFNALSEAELKYAIFSRDNGRNFKDMKDEKSQPYVKFQNEVSIFYQPFIRNETSFTNEAELYIRKARDKVFALCAFNKIPIVIKVTGAKIDPKYFIKVWKSPFIRYPELSRVIDQFDFYYTSYNDLNDKNEEGKKMDKNKKDGKKKDKNKKDEKMDKNKKDGKKKDENKKNGQGDPIFLKYVSLPELDNELSDLSEKNFNITLPLTIIQKTVPTYPDFEQWEELEPNSFLPIHYRFSQNIELIRSEYEFNVNVRGDALTDCVNVITFLELGYTPMNAYMPEMKTNIQYDTTENILSNLNQEKNVSSIMEIAAEVSGSLFLPSEPGSVQLLVGRSKTLHLSYYTRNKNSIMANANAIAAGLRTSNYVLIPVTPSHVSHFLESLDCAFLNWKRFGLAKYNLVYNQPNTARIIPKTTIIIYFERGQRPFDVEIAIKNIQYHCAKYDDILQIKFVTNIKKINDYIKIDNNNDSYNITKIELLFSIAAFATVNDLADYLELNDSYEAKSSFAFRPL